MAENALFTCLKAGDLFRLECFLRGYAQRIDELIELNSEMSRNFWSPELSFMPCAVKTLQFEDRVQTRVAVLRICVFSADASLILRVSTDSRLPANILFSPRLKSMQSSEAASMQPCELMKMIGRLAQSPPPLPPLVVIQNTPYLSIY